MRLGYRLDLGGAWRGVDFLPWHQLKPVAFYPRWFGLYQAVDPPSRENPLATLLWTRLCDALQIERPRLRLRGVIYIWFDPQALNEDMHWMRQQIAAVFEHEAWLKPDPYEISSVDSWPDFLAQVFDDIPNLPEAEGQAMEEVPKDGDDLNKTKRVRRKRSKPIKWGVPKLLNGRFVCALTNKPIDKRYYLTVNGQRKGCFASLPLLMRWMEDNVEDEKKREAYATDLRQEWLQKEIPIAPPLDSPTFNVDEYVIKWTSIPGAETVEQFRKNQRMQKLKKPKKKKAKATPGVATLKVGTYRINAKKGSKVIVDVSNDAAKAVNSVWSYYNRHKGYVLMTWAAYEDTKASAVFCRVLDGVDPLDPDAKLNINEQGCLMLAEGGDPDPTVVVGPYVLINSKTNKIELAPGVKYEENKENEAPNEEA